MGIFDFFKKPDMNQGIKEFMANPGALLLDVRTPAEFSSGHIPGSQNVPLQDLDEVEFLADNKDVRIYVYCLSGARSREATGLLHRMGYPNVTNLGGISAYTGKVER